MKGRVNKIRQQIIALVRSARWSSDWGRNFFLTVIHPQVIRHYTSIFHQFLCALYGLPNNLLAQIFCLQWTAGYFMVSFFTFLCPKSLFYFQKHISYIILRLCAFLFKPLFLLHFLPNKRSTYKLNTGKFENENPLEKPENLQVSMHRRIFGKRQPKRQFNDCDDMDHVRPSSRLNYIYGLYDVAMAL